MKEAWIQANVALTRRQGRALASARGVFARLSPLVSAHRRDGSLVCFYFMRKPPDLRLRFLIKGRRAGLERKLADALGAAKKAGEVRRWFPSVYEPETRQFGGEAGMEAVHRWFDADTTLWLAWDRLGLEGPELDRWTEAFINDLFLRTLEDGGEVWDCWSNLRRLLPSSASTTAPTEPLFLEDLAEIGSPMIAGARRANVALAKALNRAWSRGALTSGLRGILPFIAWFHWNRYGFALERQIAIADSMAASWSPKRGLRGAAKTRGRSSL